MKTETVFWKASNSLAMILILILMVGCVEKTASETDLSPANWPEGELKRYSALNTSLGKPKPLAEGSTGMVAGIQNALSVRAGLEALKQGGSAVDAVITTSLATTVLSMGSGMSFAGTIDMIYFDAATGQVHSMNGDWQTVQGETDPLSIPNTGTPCGRTALVPGFMAGIQAAHDRFGTLPFEKLFEPAIYFAEKGFAIGPKKARLLAFRQDVLTRLPEGRAIFTKENGEFFKEGDVFKQSLLAETLRKVSVLGADYMYRGEWARKFVDIVQREGGKMTLKDLEDYQILWASALKSTYRDYQVYAPALPSIGGVNTIEVLNLVELSDLPQYGHFSASPDGLYWFIQFARLYNLLPILWPGLISKYMPGADFSPESRIKKETAETLWEAMQKPEWALVKQDVYEVTKNVSGRLESFFENLEKKKHTDAVVAVDEAGNVAAVVHTCNCAYWGTTGIFVDGVSIPDSGSFYQDTIEAIGPNARIPKNLNPLIVMKNGKPVLACGSAGFALHEVTVQNLVNVLDFGMDPKSAAETVNFMVPVWVGPESNMQMIKEGDFSKDIIEAVQALGQPLKILSEDDQKSLFEGFWVGIHIDPETGKLRGGVCRHLTGFAEGY